jgi:hypothetical protein
MSTSQRARTRGHREWARWIRSHGLTYAAAGQLVGVSDVTAMEWARGSKTPCADNRMRIEIVTGGAIRSQDWQRDALRVQPFRGAPSDDREA